VELVRDDPEPRVRFCAVYALAQLRAEDVEGLLVDALKDPAPVVRMGAAEALGSVRARGAIPDLRDALESDPDKYVRLSALESLVLLGEKESQARAPEVLRAIPWHVRRNSRYRPFRRAVEAAEAGEPLTPWREETCAERSSREPGSGGSFRSVQDVDRAGDYEADRDE
jgi:hypothetical protein